MSNSLLGTGTLVGLALRRDRILLPAWALGFAGMAGFSAAATAGLYPDAGDRYAAATLVNSTASLVALYGRIYDPTSEGALSLFKLTAFGAALVAILMTVVVIRHTRTEEEAGRLELLGSTMVGRSAPLAAALLVALIGSLGIGALTAGALILAGLPVAGSLAFGLGWAAAGISFAVVAGICAQLTTSGRSAIGLGMTAIAVAYTLRAVGDLSEHSPGWQSWLSPIGWTQQIRAYAGESWWVLILPIVFAVVLVPVAFVLRERRDLDAGLLTVRPGAPAGRIDSSLGLAWRLQRGVLLAWAIGFSVFGAVLGSVADSVSSFFDSPQMQQYLVILGGEQGLTDAFLAAEIGMVGVIATAFGIMAAHYLRVEETAGHAENLLATPERRLPWATSHLVIALGGVALLCVLAGVAIGVGYASTTGDWAYVGDLALAGLARVPAAWVITAVVLVLFGWLPRWTSLAWGIYAVAVVVGEFGELWGAPQWLMDLSPFLHSPLLPSATADLGALAPLVAVAAIGVAVGLVGWRRRDLAP